jgi:hypothetical protein
MSRGLRGDFGLFQAHPGQRSAEQGDNLGEIFLAPEITQDG